MRIDRRGFLTGAVALAAGPVIAGAPQAPPALAAYERATGGRVGLYAENLGTGARVAWRGHERFVMCSTFKASLAARVLARIDRGEDRLDARICYGPDDVPDWHAPVARQNLAHGSLSVAETCAAAVAYSDNTCANLLLARTGGPSALTAFWRSCDDPVTRLDHNEPLLNRSQPGDPHDTTTPLAMAGTLRRLVLGTVLSSDSRQRLTGWLVDCKTGDNRLRGGLPRDWRVGDKTGNNGEDAAGDIAVAWPPRGAPVLICAYTQGGSPSADRLQRLFADIGHLVADRLG